MAVYRGGGKGGGSGGVNGGAARMPWRRPAPLGREGYSRGPPAAPSSGRKLLSDKRIVGCVEEWNRNWGFVKVLQQVSHQRLRSDGRIFVKGADVRDHAPLVVGSRVDFFLYSDAKGLGAADVRAIGGDEHDENGEENERSGATEHLPGGWSKVWSPENGAFYYWHAGRKESSWDVPEEAKVAGAEPDPEDAEQPLPEGWEKHFDPEQKAYYYWHAETKSTTWDRPDDNMGAAPPVTAAEEEQEEDDTPEGPVVGQQRFQGKVTEWQSFYGYIEPTVELSSDLKPMLEESQNRIALNWREVRPGNKIEVGSEVDFLVCTDETGLAAYDVRIPEAPKEEMEPPPSKKNIRRRTRDPMEELKAEWAKVDRELRTEEGNAAEAKAAATPEPGTVAKAELLAEAPLLPGWEQQWSAEHQCHYYWHSEAKQACWERPAVIIDLSEGDDEGLPVKPSQKDDGAKKTIPRMATPITPLVSKPGRVMTPITPLAAGGKRPAPPASAAAAQEASREGQTATPQARPSTKGMMMQPPGARFPGPVAPSSRPPAWVLAGAKRPRVN